MVTSKMRDALMEFPNLVCEYDRMVLEDITHPFRAIKFTPEAAVWLVEALLRMNRLPAQGVLEHEHTAAYFSPQGHSPHKPFPPPQLPSSLGL